jgi:hypothetical protein
MGNDRAKLSTTRSDWLSCSILTQWFSCPVCQGAARQTQRQTWITCAWPPENREILDWQWQEKLIPYWTKLAIAARDCGVTKLCIELHGAQLVYNVPTLLTLRRENYITIGYGHGEQWWREFCYRLRLNGYDGWLSIEHEDIVLSRVEGMRSIDLLQRVLIDEPSDYALPSA